MNMADVKLARRCQMQGGPEEVAAPRTDVRKQNL